MSDFEDAWRRFERKVFRAAQARQQYRDAINKCDGPLTHENHKCKEGITMPSKKKKPKQRKCVMCQTPVVSGNTPGLKGVQMEITKTYTNEPTGPPPPPSRLVLPPGAEQPKEMLDGPSEKFTRTLCAVCFAGIFNHFQQMAQAGQLPAIGIGIQQKNIVTPNIIPPRDIGRFEKN